MSLAILLADGLRPDTLEHHLAAGSLPAIAGLRERGAAHTRTTVFPSVTGPAYLPFFTGQFPGPLGVPGLRWYDRARERCRFPDYTRSYLGAEMRHMTGDLEAGVPTIFERVASRYAALQENAEYAGAADRSVTLLVSDHGHDRIATHDDLADAARAAGWRTIGHPWVYGD